MTRSPISLRGKGKGVPYRDLDHYDAYMDRLCELDHEDHPAYIREVRALDQAQDPLSHETP